MELFTTGNFKITESLVTEYTSGQMVAIMRDKSKMDSGMERGSIHSMMLHMKDSGLKAKRKEKAKLFSRVEVSLKEPSKTT